AAGSAYSNILTTVVGEAFMPSGSPLGANFSGAPPGASGLGMSSNARGGIVSQAPGQPWRAWTKGRITGTTGDDLTPAGSVDWQHITVVTGSDYRVAPGLLIGGFGGYETFRYTRSDIAGKLT